MERSQKCWQVCKLARLGIGSHAGIFLAMDSGICWKEGLQNWIGVGWQSYKLDRAKGLDCGLKILATTEKALPQEVLASLQLARLGIDVKAGFFGGRARHLRGRMPAKTLECSLASCKLART